MSYQLKDIMHETKTHFVIKLSKGKKAGGYEVYKIGVTHATRCAQIGFKGEKGLAWAIAECDRRAAS